MVDVDGGEVESFCSLGSGFAEPAARFEMGLKRAW